MKQIICCLFLSLGFSFISFAQSHGQKEVKTPEQRAEGKAQKLTKELTLSADQTTKIKAILVSNEQSEESIKTKYANATDKTPMKQEIKTLKENTDKQIKGVLTADQYTKYQTLQKEHGGHGGHGGGGGHKNGQHGGHQH